jgi:hypothetical protein
LAGFAALDEALGPAGLAARLGAEPPEAAPRPPVECAAAATGAGVWWTAGAPLVPATVLVLPAMPDGRRFAAMLDAQADEDHNLE